MNILFIHEVDWLKKVVFDIHTLAEALSLRGHQIFVIDYENAWNKDGSFDLGSLRTKEVDGISRAFSGSAVCLRRPGFIKIPGLSRISGAFTHYLEIQKTINERDIDAIVLYSAPTNGLQTIHLARKFNIPVVFRSIDILHQLVPCRPLRAITKLLEARVYSAVDAILTLTPRLSDYVMDLGANQGKVRLLRMPVDIDLFQPSDGSLELRKQWGLPEDAEIIVFMGTLFGFSGVDMFIRQFPKVIEQIPKAKLLIVGDGSQRLELERLIAQLSLQGQVIITGFQPYQMMPRYINLASLCIIPFLVTDATRDIFPGKIVQYLACGKATVATLLPGTVEVIAGERQGVVFVNSFEDMATQVIGLLRTPERRQQLGDAGLNYVRRFHDCRKVAENLESILSEVIWVKKQ